MKSKFSLLSMLLIGTFLLAACGPSAEQAATMTASAWPPTPLPTATATLTPTITPSPTPTNTPFVPRLTLKIVSNSPASTDIARAAELAVAQLAMPLQETGIKVEFAAYDDQHDIDVAVANANQIVADPLVMCGVGHFASRVSIPASDIYHLAGLAFISPSSTMPKLTDRGYPEINRVVGRDNEQGAAGARFGAPPQLFAAEAYDAAGVCLKAIEEAARAKGGEAPTRQEVAQAIRALRDYKGITGTITFNAKGDLQPATYYVFQVVSVDPGKWEQNPIITAIQAAPPE